MKDQSGQVMVEYAIMLVMCVGIALVMMILMFYFNEYGWRAINLVSIDYP
jgi:Flp pilus assembly pilin Flp